MWNIYLQIFSLIFISSILTDIHLVIGSILSDPTHREAWNVGNEIILPFLQVFKEFFTYADPKSSLFIFSVPLASLTVSIFILSLFSRQKNIRLIFFFIIFILILKTILDHNFIDHFLIGIFDILKVYNFQRIDRVIPIAFTLLFILYVTDLKNKSLRNFLYFLTFFSILSIQLKTPLLAISQHFLKTNI